MAKDQTLTLFGDSDTPVPAIDPSGVIYVLHVRGTRTKEVEGPRLSPMWTAKRVPNKYPWSPGSFIEPAKPLFQVGYNQKVMFSRVLGPLVFLVDWNFDCCHVSRGNE